MRQKTTGTLKSISDVESAFREWAGLDTKIRTKTAAADQRIDGIRAKLKSVVQSAVERIAALRQSIELFARKRKKDLVSDDVKSRDFTHGRIKFIEQREQVMSADDRDLPVVLRELLDNLKLKQTVRELLDKRIKVSLGDERSIPVGELLDVDFCFSLTRIKSAQNEKKLITAEELALLGLKVARDPENIQLTLRDAT